jgi:hydroxymethylbilane synthase
MTDIARIGSRGSRLALWQADHVQRLLAERCGLQTEIVVIKTSGDRFAEKAGGNLGDLGLKGVFIKELEEALLDGRADLAVHSMKDVPTEIDSSFSFPAVLSREDPRDCLVAPSGATLAGLSPGARVGTSSVRRQAQLRHHRPDIEIVPLRGNVDTRLAKLDRGEFDAIVVAKAGLDRLGFSARITDVLGPDAVLSAVGQGALGIETRAGDPHLCKLVATLADADTRAAVNAERALLSELEGGCQVPVGAWARFENGGFVIDACVVAPDGSEYIRLSARASAEEMQDRRTPLNLGRELGRRLIEAGADRILRLLGRTP